MFTSQSGTSTLTQIAQKKIRAMGYPTVAITEADDTPLAKESCVHLRMETDHEEYGMRTIGYCSAVFTQMILEITAASMKWFDDNKWKLMNNDAFVIYGNDTLWGVAVEGALKILEIAKRYMAVGYEMDDGLHGPTMGFTNRHCILALNDGGKDNKYAKGVCDYVKNEVGTAFIIGCNPIDDSDFSFTPKGGHFKCLEYAPVVEVLAYRLAVDYGVVLKPWKEQDPLPEMKYFNTHDE